MNVIVRSVENGYIIEHQPGNGRTMRTWIAKDGGEIVQILKLIFMVVDEVDLEQDDK